MGKGETMIQHASDHEPPLQQVAGHKLRREVRQHYEMLLQRLPWPAGGASAAPRTIGLSSCRSGEGVSTVAAHLAIAAAAFGDYPVLLVDANFARPCVPRIFGVRGRPGLAEAIRELSACRGPAAFRGGQSFLVGGRDGRPAVTGVFAAPAMEGLIKELAGEFDLVVVDLPAVDRARPRRLPMAGRLDGIVLVLEAGRAPCEAAQRVSDLLVRAGAHLLGVVLNKWQEDVPAWLSHTP